MEKKISAVVLSVTDYKDNDRMLTLLSPEGKLNAVLRGVKKKDAKLKAFAQPFCFAEFILAGERLPVVAGASMQEAFYELAYDPEKYFRAMTVLELASCATSFDAPSPEVFFCLLRALQSLQYAEIAPSVVLVKFIFELVAALGYRQRYDLCNVCGEIPEEFALNLSQGGLVCRACVEARPISVEYARLLWKINTKPLDELGGLNADEIEKILCKECERLLGVKLRSAEYL